MLFCKEVESPNAATVCDSRPPWLGFQAPHRERLRTDSLEKLWLA